MDTNVPNWDLYFMGIAESVKIRSKDPNTKVGAVVVNPERIIIGTGYNGMPPGWPQAEEAKLWDRPIKYDYVVHAEMNCILHAHSPVRGCTLYVTLFPCKECIKLVASSGIKRIVYANAGAYENDITKKVCNLSQISLEKMVIP